MSNLMTLIEIHTQLQRLLRDLHMASIDDALTQQDARDLLRMVQEMRHFIRADNDGPRQQL